VAYIAVIELTVNQWLDVITILVQNVTGQQLGQNELLKEASLEAIGYICADIVSVTYEVFVPSGVICAGPVGLER
jgi:hypothetical protein